MNDTLEQQDRILERVAKFARIQTLAKISHKGEAYPIYQIEFGSPNPKDVQLAFIGGVHGLERIGSEVLLSHLHTLSEQMEWDEAFQERLKTSRLLFIPVLNPVGVKHSTRSNGNGVDLMRNGFLDAQPLEGPLYRGHRLSAHLPWYRGPAGGPLEEETQVLYRAMEKELFSSPLSFAIDVHSGFGAKDRLWFPFGHQHTPFPHVAETLRFKLLFDKTHPHHFYQVEPVSTQYTIHGDLWDEIYFKRQALPDGGAFIPFTLEMGSWNWLRKNPLQIFQRVGIFHPLKPHRHHRILRRHGNLFDFFHRSLLSWKNWWPKSEEEREQLRVQAKDLWYKGVS